MTKGFAIAVVSLLVVKFLKQFQTDEVDQNHLDWMGLVFFLFNSIWVWRIFQVVVAAAISLLVVKFKKKKIQIYGVDGKFQVVFLTCFCRLRASWISTAFAIKSVFYIIHREAYLKEMCILIYCCWIEKLNELNPSLVLYEILQLIRLCCIT